MLRWESARRGLQPIELVLGEYAFEFSWSRDETWIQEKSNGEAAAEALETAFRHACRSEVRAVIDEMKAADRFDDVDWFGDDGVAIGQEVSSAVESRLTAYAEG